MGAERAEEILSRPGTTRERIGAYLRETVDSDLAQPVRRGCMATLRMTTRSVSRFYDRQLSRAGLRATGYGILSVLAREGPIPISGLAGRLAMDRTTCTREVAPLVREGLVEIMTGSDRRRRLVRMTSLGERKHSGAHEAWEQAQQAVVGELGGADIHDLLMGLRRLLASSERLNCA